MNIVTSFNPASASSGTFNVVLPGNRGKMLVYNESNVNIQLTFSNNYTTYVPAWTAMLYCLNSLTSPLVTWTVYSQLTSSGAPISQVVIETFEANEVVPGTYPAALVRQTNIGNAVQTVATGASFLLNNGQPPLTNIITATPSDAGSATWNADNSGNLTVKSDNAGTLVTLLQLIAGASPSVKLAAAAVLTEALGNLKVDGTFESVGAATLDSTLVVTGDTTFNGSGNGITVTNNALISGNETVSGTLAVTGTSTFTGDATFNGSGNGVSIAHNLAVTGTGSLENGAITTDGSGNIVLNNANSYQGKNSTGTAKGILYVSSGNVTALQAANSSIEFRDSSGNAQVTVNTGGGSGALTFGSGNGITWKSGDTLSLTHALTVNFTNTVNTSQTFSHGVSGTPFAIIATYSGVGAASWGINNITSTQFSLTSSLQGTYRCVCFLG